MSDARNQDGDMLATVEALQAELERERTRAREIDHRAKNSLQLAGSLALLTGRRATSPETQRTLKSLHQRIAAIAAAHRGFISGPGPANFDLAGFLGEQLAALRRAGPAEAELDLDLGPVRITPPNAAPAALIVNELVGNGLAHGGLTPKVAVSLASYGEGWRLVVRDHGPGLPADADQRGFGLTIVKLMVQQLRATLATEDAQPGLRVVVTVP